VAIPEGGGAGIRLENARAGGIFGGIDNWVSGETMGQRGEKKTFVGGTKVKTGSIGWLVKGVRGNMQAGGL